MIQFQSNAQKTSFRAQGATYASNSPMSAMALTTAMTALMRQAKLVSSVDKDDDDDYDE